MDIKEAHRRVLAAQKLLSGSSTLEKFTAARKLLKGIRPELDQMLEECERHLSTAGNLLQGDLVSLTAEHLPEVTEEERKRKRAILYVVEQWNKLKGEVARVEKELAAAGDSGDKSQKQNHWANILKHAVGPVGLVTVLALGIALLQTTSVQVEIKNNGCGRLEASGSLPPLPGFSLPQGTIENGGSGTATLPPLTLAVDGTKAGRLLLTAFTFTLTFELPASVTGVTMDGTALLGKKTEIHLSERQEHTLTLSCRG